MHLETLLSLIKNNPGDIKFNDVITLINQQYRYTPTQFKMGSQNT